MHDCPTCKVPLHGHEETCPSCGTRQYVRRGAFIPRTQEAPGVNLVPIVLVFLAIGVALFFLAQSTWIGQLMRQGPPPEDPMAKLTYLDARKIIEDKITEGLTAVGATGKFTWKSGESEADKNADQSEELTIETSLSDPNQRKAIIDPVKEYMEKAKIPTLIMIDTKSHATWTYSVTPAASAPVEQ